MIKQTFEFLRTHPGATFRIMLVLLITTVVLQNYESTTVDFLFWSLTNSPKIVVILVSMLLGALVWELFRPDSFRGPSNQG